MRNRGTASVDVLVVCTGNICRSPYIQARLSAALPQLRIESAGTAAVVGSPPEPEILHALDAHGVGGADKYRAQSATSRLIRSAKLVITATFQHRLEVIRTDRRATSRTFTLKELARVSEAMPDRIGPERVAALAREILDQPSDRDFDDDLADPYGLDEAAYQSMTNEADAAINRLIRVL